MIPRGVSRQKVNSMNIVWNAVFFGVTIVLSLFVATRTEDFFRFLGRGMYDQNKPSTTELILIRNIARIVVVGLTLTLALKLFGFMN